jgi:glycogen operon protein
MQRNFLATLLFSQGVPMIRGGDECGGTQRGNNNAYCQDNETSWLDWRWDEDARKLFEFTRSLIGFFKQHPIFRQPKFFQGRDLRGSGIKDITWINAEGREMSDEEWKAEFAKVLGVMLGGDSLSVTDYFGEVIRDDTFLLFFNAHHEDVWIRLQGGGGVEWREVFDTAKEPGFLAKPRTKPGGSRHRLRGRSMIILRQVAGSDEEARGCPQAPAAPANAAPGA